MREQSQPGGEVGEAADKSAGSGKAPYGSPRFVVYGDLSRITAAKASTKGDGPGVPPSKA